jgi:hypothetical protein
MLPAGPGRPECVEPDVPRVQIDTTLRFLQQADGDEPVLPGPAAADLALANPFDAADPGLCEGKESIALQGNQRGEQAVLALSTLINSAWMPRAWASEIRTWVRPLTANWHSPGPRPDESRIQLMISPHISLVWPGGDRVAANARSTAALRGGPHWF